MWLLGLNARQWGGGSNVVRYARYDVDADFPRRPWAGSGKYESIAVRLSKEPVVQSHQLLWIVSIRDLGPIAYGELILQGGLLRAPRRWYV